MVDANTFHIGLDAGSISVKYVVLNQDRVIVKRDYIRHNGDPQSVIIKTLIFLFSNFPNATLSITGSTAKTISKDLGIKYINEIVSQSYSVKKLYPHIKTIIELGGEDAKLIILRDGRIHDFSINSVCAAGTGSFLEQQAERLRFSIEDFSKVALKSQRPSKIAGRCSVFAKSDMIHLQQIATPVQDIVAGLCFAVARNFKGAIVRGRDLPQPIIFQGGVAANQGMIRAFKEIFKLDELYIPNDFAHMGAIGAVLKDLDDNTAGVCDLNRLSTLQKRDLRTFSHKPLISNEADFNKRHSPEHKYLIHPIPLGITDAFLGIDIGSISTNLALIDTEGRLLAKRYLMTAGRPIEAVMQGFRELNDEIGSRVRILGVGTTGSGRYMIADYVGADIVKNEITAQATAAAFIDKNVDTIFEIGGQDSKYISLKDGVIVDFEMNKACAAGTGSFIEEQAEKLGVSVKQEFATLSCSASHPCRLGERCTVFMENSLMANLQSGAKKNDLLAGLAYSIVQNYINRVVAGRHIGERIFFQGGVAFNKAVVAAFEQYLGKEIIIPPHHDVTGAIGMALIARDDFFTKKVSGLNPQSNFKGFTLFNRAFEISSFECKGCPNVCEINKVKIACEDDNKQLFYGGRCEKYDIRRLKKNTLPDLFAFREEMLWHSHNSYLQSNSAKKSLSSIAIPYIFYFQDYLPFWSTLLWEIGFDVKVSPKTNKSIINMGVESVMAEACFPVKSAHGHVKYLLNNGYKNIFTPSFINLNTENDEFSRGLACPHTQSIPYVVRAAITDVNYISPIIDYSKGKNFLVDELYRWLKSFGVSRQKIESAIAKANDAQNSFVSALKLKGKEILAQVQQSKTPIIVMVGRSYNTFDQAMNLSIPQKLQTLDILSIPMDFLPIEDEKIADRWNDLYWRSGQRIIKSAKFIKKTKNLYPIFISNFSCGPDSFICKYFDEEIGGKPYLHIEIDEHSADAGAITRCEAFLDSINQQNTIANKVKAPVFAKRQQIPLKDRIVYIPNMCDHAYAIQAAFVHNKIQAEVLPESDKISVDIGKRYVSGRECYPYLVTAGDMLKKVLSPDFNPDKSAFLMPSGSGPCRFGQYNIGHRLLLNKLGFNNVPIFSPVQDVQFYNELGIVGKDFIKIIWKGIVAYELLTKCLHEKRPVENNKGDAENLFNIYHKRIYDTLTKGALNMDDLMRQMAKDFASISVRNEHRRFVGIVGEIYVRSHRFSNEDLVKKIEALGGIVWLAPVQEWFNYLNTIFLRKALIKKETSAIINIFLKSFWQSRIEHRFSSYFNGILKTHNEPNTKTLFKKALPYIHDSFEGEAVLSIGKAVDLIEHGIKGIVSAMPFGCMPGTIVTALLKAVSADYSTPCISLPYDGTESPSTELQLEAFMEAVNSR